MKRILKKIKEAPQQVINKLDRKYIEKHLKRTAIFLVILLFLILIFTVVRNSFFGEIDPTKYIYFEIVLLLLLAVLAESVVYYLKQESVVILMVLGMIISPTFIDMSWEFLHSLPLPIELPAKVPEFFHHTEIIHIFGQLGAVILLFKVGLHSKIEKIFSKTNILVAVAGIIVPFAMGYAYAVITGGNFAFSMFVGAALSATSVGVTVAVLKSLNVIKKKFAEIIIGAAILDDVLALLVLSVVVNLADGSGGALSSVIYTFLTAIVFILGAILTGKYIIEYIDRQEMGPKRFLLALSFMLFFSYIAEIIKLSSIVGAFIAGVILSQSKSCSQLEDKTYGLEMLFTPIFFISLGMLIDIKSIAMFIIPILILTLIAIISKIIGPGIVALWSKLNFSESLLIGLGMVPRGEVALIIAAIGLTKGILSNAEYSIISAMALLTSIVVPSIISFVVNKNRAKLS